MSSYENMSKLWYAHPAIQWSQGLPLGNGRMGAMVIASPQREVWSVTESSYWSGQTEDTPVEGGKSALEAVRNLLFAGDYAGADRLAKQHFQPVKRNFGTHLGMCNAVIEFEASFPDKELEFKRELDLTTALIKTTNLTEEPESNLYREMFTSHSEDLLVSRIWGEGAGNVSFSFHLEGQTAAFTCVPSSTAALEFHGKATENVHSDGSCGVSCQGWVEIDVTGGSVRAEGQRLIVEDADEAFIYFAVRTNYELDPFNRYETAKEEVKRALTKGYKRLKAEHLADYCPLFDRVSIELGSKDISATAPYQLPTDQRISSLLQGEDDPQLFALFFQYGRYLTIAGSRENSGLPMHLQGIWNDGEACRMGWSCDYHLDINTQMNYYPTEVINLGESHMPLMRYLQDLAKAGETTARNYYNSPGWVAHVFSNIWEFTDPGWDTSWGLNVTGGLWLAVHMIEHYRYSCDLNFLETQAYPVLREASVFFLDYMTIHPVYGWLVTGPSNSPENHFYPGSKEEGAWQLSMGSTIDQVLVRELFQFCLETEKFLGNDNELKVRLEEAILQLPPLLIGKKGQIQEWLEDYEEAQPEHRHMSHLFALYPANQITPERTPELAAAAKVTLENRMQQDELEDIEFTAALFALYYARLQDGDRALSHVSHLISALCFDNLFTFSKAGIAGAESNIFVIDGNLGGTAAIAEMLLQSHSGEICLLPALPTAWTSGKVTGLKVKGNAEVDLAWHESQLTCVHIRTFSQGVMTVRLGTHKVSFEVNPGIEYIFDGQLKQTSATTLMN